MPPDDPPAPPDEPLPLVEPPLPPDELPATTEEPLVATDAPPRPAVEPLVPAEAPPEPAEPDLSWRGWVASMDPSPHAASAQASNGRANNVRLAKETGNMSLKSNETKGRG
jgi:hypothetical protein